MDQKNPPNDPKKKESAIDYLNSFDQGTPGQSAIDYLNSFDKPESPDSEIGMSALGRPKRKEDFNLFDQAVNGILSFGRKAFFEPIETESGDKDVSNWENFKRSVNKGTRQFTGSASRGIGEVARFLTSSGPGSDIPMTWNPNNKEQVQEAYSKRLDNEDIGGQFIGYADKQKEKASNIDTDADHWTGIAGQVVPYTAGTITAVATSPFSAGVAGAVGTANLSALALSSFGSGIEAYDDYKQSKVDEGVTPETDPFARLGVGLLYGTAEFAMERVQLKKFMPKGLSGKAGKLFFGSVPEEIIEKKGKDLVEQFAKSTPTRGKLIGELAKASGKGGVFEGSTELATEVAQEFTNWLYYEAQDKQINEQFFEQLTSAYVGGSMMGNALGPLSYGSQQAANKRRREKAGKVVLAQNKKTGEAIEIIAPKSNKEESGARIYEAVKPNGKIIEVSEEDINEVVELTYDSFNSILKGKQDAEAIINEKDNIDLSIEAQTQRGELEMATRDFVFTDQLGNELLQPANFDGETVYIKGQDPNNSDLLFAVDANGRTRGLNRNQIELNDPIPYQEWLDQNSGVNNEAPFDPSNPIQVGEQIDIEVPNQNGELVPHVFKVTGLDRENGEVQLESMTEEDYFETLDIESYNTLRGTQATQSEGAEKLDSIFNPGDEVELEVPKKEEPQPEVKEIAVGKRKVKIQTDPNGDMRVVTDKEMTQAEAKALATSIKSKYSKLKFSVVDETNQDDPFSPDSFALVYKNPANQIEDGQYFQKGEDIGREAAIQLIESGYLDDLEIKNDNELKNKLVRAKQEKSAGVAAQYKDSSREEQFTAIHSLINEFNNGKEEVRSGIEFLAEQLKVNVIKKTRNGNDIAIADRKSGQVINPKSVQNENAEIQSDEQKTAIEENEGQSDQQENLQTEEKKVNPNQSTSPEQTQERKQNIVNFIGRDPQNFFGQLGLKMPAGKRKKAMFEDIASESPSPQAQELLSQIEAMANNGYIDFHHEGGGVESIPINDFFANMEEEAAPEEIQSELDKLVDAYSDSKGNIDYKGLADAPGFITDVLNEQELIELKKIIQNEKSKALDNNEQQESQTLQASVDDQTSEGASSPIEQSEESITDSRRETSENVVQNKVSKKEALKSKEDQLLDELSDLWNEFGNSNTANSGISPKQFEIAGKLIAKAAELGLNKFEQIIQALIEKLGKAKVQENFDAFKAAYGAQRMLNNPDGEDLNTISQKSFNDFEAKIETLKTKDAPTLTEKQKIEQYKSDQEEIVTYLEGSFIDKEGVKSQITSIRFTDHKNASVEIDLTRDKKTKTLKTNTGDLLDIIDGASKEKMMKPEPKTQKEQVQEVVKEGRKVTAIEKDKKVVEEVIAPRIQKEILDEVKPDQVPKEKPVLFQSDPINKPSTQSESKIDPDSPLNEVQQKLAKEIVEILDTMRGSFRKGQFETLPEEEAKLKKLEQLKEKYYKSFKKSLNQYYKTAIEYYQDRKANYPKYAMGSGWNEGKNRFADHYAQAFGYVNADYTRGVDDLMIQRNEYPFSPSKKGWANDNKLITTQHPNGLWTSGYWISVGDEGGAYGASIYESPFKTENEAQIDGLNKFILDLKKRTKGLEKASHQKRADQLLSEAINKLNELETGSLFEQNPSEKRKLDQDVSGTTNNLESDSPRKPASDLLGSKNVSTKRRGSGESTQQLGLFTDPPTPDKGGKPIPATDAVDGTRGNQELPSKPSRPERSANSDRNKGASNRNSQEGNEQQPHSSGSNSTQSTFSEDDLDFETKRLLQDQAEATDVKVSDRDNLTETLPVLMAPQRDDVFKAENRFYSDGKKGILFTNGTGTGKTYTGLGIVKRFVKRGLDNILIVTPTDEKNKDWKDDGKNLNLDISILKDTKDKGKGVVITTYANFRSNDALKDREWDLVVYDESHKLTQGGSDAYTSAVQKHLEITNPARTAQNKIESQMRDQKAEVLAKLKKKYPQTAEEKANDNYWLYEDRVKNTDDYKKAIKKIEEDGAKEVDRLIEKTKVVFLSATPFAYHRNLLYADGFLFEIQQTKEMDNTGYSYNSGNKWDNFMMSNFGYRMRYNKLTRPEAAVDTGLLERKFLDNLVKEGAVSRRKLEVEADYSREFVKVGDELGNTIDQAFREIYDDKELRDLGFNDVLSKKWNYLFKQQFLEAVKARAAVDRIKEHLALGRKVVVFHNYVTNNPSHPFRINVNELKIKENNYNRSKKAVDRFREKYPHLWDLDLSGLKNPIDTLRDAFGDELAVFNGTAEAKRGNKRSKDIKAFNTDNSKKNVILIQTESGKEGISLHDKTGKHQRALLNLGLPNKPTDLTQLEGRIYRLGVRSNAVIEHLTLQISFEKYSFNSGEKSVAQKARTVENLALGSEARDLFTAIRTGYENYSENTPSLEQGFGSKENDNKFEELSPYEMAKTYYYSQRKATSQNKASRGVDYFATPEPLGFKMVQWLYAKENERLLEPSAGHGAIARFFPDYVESVAIEPSYDLSADLTMNAMDSRIEGGTFEEYHIINKFDGIAMNPPFGSGGKTAVEHLIKATKHLNDGGRVIAILPNGPAMQKRFDQWYESKDSQSMILRKEILLPGSTFRRAGTSVNTKIVILDKINSKEAREKVQSSPESDFRQYDKVEELFDALEDFMVLDRPTIETPEERQAGEYTQEVKQIETTIPEVANSAKDFGLELIQNKHTKYGHDIFTVVLNNQLERDEFNLLRNSAKGFDGYYSKFKGNGAIPGFVFKDKDMANRFLEEAVVLLKKDEKPLFKLEDSLANFIDSKSLSLPENIQGRFLTPQQVEVIEREIIENRPPSIEQIFNKDYQDIRQNMWNFDYPIAEKSINGVQIRIIEGLIRDKKKSYLIYADKNMIGEFFSVKDAKSAIDYVESNLIKAVDSQKPELGDKPLLKKLDTKGRSLEVEAVQTKINELTKNWKNAPVINVFKDIDEMVQSFPELRPYVNNRVAALYHKGQVFVNAAHPNHKYHKGTEKIVLHEVMGHHGVIGFVKKYANDFNQEWKKLSEDIFSIIQEEPISQKLAFTYFQKTIDNLTDEEADILVQEYLANMAEKKPNSSVAQKIRTWFKKLLRKLGINISFSEDDINDLIKNAYSFVQNENGEVKRRIDVQLTIRYSKPEQTNTPEFKKWFGNSKVVDENGEPLVVYHGTPEGGFNEFSDDKKGTRTNHNPEDVGFHFTNDKDYASTYSKEYMKSHYPALIEVFGYIPEASKAPDNAMTYQVYLSLQNPMIVQYSNAINQSIIDKAIQNGHDGIIGRLSENTVEYVVFSPTQIKSATENNGQFDTNNPDIRFKVSDDQLGLFSATPDQIGSTKRTEVKSKINTSKSELDRLLNLQKQSYSKDRQYQIDTLDREIIRLNNELSRTLSYDKATRGGEQQNLFGPMFKLYDVNEPSIEEPAEIKRGRMKQAYEKYKLQFTERFIDNMIRSKLMIKNKVGEKVKDSSDFYTKENLAKGRALELSNNFERDYWNPFLKFSRLLNKRFKVSVEEIGDYLYALHAPERNEFIKSQYSGDKGEAFGSGMSEEEANQIIQDFEKKVPEKYRTDLKDRVQSMNQWVNKRRLTTGIISQETHDQLNEMYENYVPLRGWKDLMEEDETVYAPLISAKGRNSKAGNPIPFLMAAVQESIIKGEQNLVKQSLLEFLKENPDKSAYSIRNAWLVKTGEQNENGDDVWILSTNKPTQQQIMNGDAVRDYSPEVQRAIKFGGKADHVVSVMVNGKKVFMEFTDSSIARSIKNMDQVKNPIPKLKAMTRWLSSMYTQYSPEFGLRNLIRDFGFGSFNAIAESGTGAWAKTAKKMPASMKALMKHFWTNEYDNSKEHKMLREFMEEGAMTGYTSLNDVKDIMKSAEKTINRMDQEGILNITKNKTSEGIEAALKPIEVYNKAFENAMRFSYYKTLRESGVSKQQAAAKAKDLTVNFNRKGNASSFLGSVYIFLNASVQGTVRLARNFKDPKTRKAAFGMLGAIVASGLAQSLMYAFAGDEDDDGEKYYDKVPEYIKRTHIVIPSFNGEDGEFFKIPLPYGINVFYSFGEQVGELLTGKTKPSNAALGLMSTASDSFSPIGGFDFESDANVWEKITTFFAPSVTKPGVELAFNKSFTGAPIYQEPFLNDGLKQPNSQMYMPGINPIIKDFTDFLNKSTGGDEVIPGTIDINPEYIEHFIESYFGGPVSFSKNLSGTIHNLLSGDNVLEDPNYRKIPFYRNYLLKAGTDYQERQSYYSRLMELKEVNDNYQQYLKLDPTEAKKYFRLNREPIVLYDQTKSLNSQISELSTKIRKMSEKGDSPDKLYDLRTDLYKRFNKLYMSKIKRPIE